MIMKNRILLLKDYLQDNSDEQHPVTTAEIRRYLEENGCPVSIQTLRTDIASLVNSGYEIEITETEGMPTKYGWITRDWSLPELQILVDAVSSSQFITKKKSKELIQKLSRLSGPSAREELQPRILVSEHIKAPNEQILYIVQAIRKAIRNDRQISFRYFHYNKDKERIAKHEGSIEKKFVVSPYATVWNNDRYYLVGWNDEKKDECVFRIDRMETPEILRKKRIPAPEGFKIQKYTDEVFQMFKGEQETVTLRCRNCIMDQVIDKFGENVQIENVQNDTFDITLPVRVSGTFYAWVFQFVGEMNIVAPGNVANAYADYLQEAIDDVLGTVEPIMVFKDHP